MIISPSLSLYSVFPLSRSVSLSDSLAIPHFLTLSPSVSFSFCLPLYTVVFIITDVYGAERNGERDYAFSEDMEDIEKGVYLTPV